MKPAGGLLSRNALDSRRTGPLPLCDALEEALERPADSPIEPSGRGPEGSSTAGKGSVELILLTGSMIVVRSGHQALGQLI